jgi:hypothetical protein
MFKQTLAAAALAFMVAAPANAATPLPTALGGLMSFSRDATRVYVLRTGTALLPAIERFKFAQEVAPGSSPNQPFPPLPGLDALTAAGSQGSTQLAGLAAIPQSGRAVISKFTVGGSSATAPLAGLTVVRSRLSLKR